MVSSPDPVNEDSDTDEFENDRFDRSRSGDPSVRRRRRRKRSRHVDFSVLLRTIGAAVLCVMLVVFGVLLGANYRPSTTTAERYRLAVEAQEEERNRWLGECGKKGYSEWTCGRFDSDHIAIAERLDEFKCDNIQERMYHCRYTLGDATVVVAIPTSDIVHGEYLAPEAKPRAIISHSDAEKRHYVSVSENGRIEFRERGSALSLIVINPSTGTLTAPLPNTGSEQAKPSGVDAQASSVNGDRASARE